MRQDKPRKVRNTKIVPSKENVESSSRQNQNKKRPWRQIVRHRARQLRRAQEKAENVSVSIDGNGGNSSAEEAKKKNKLGKKKRAKRKKELNIGQDESDKDEHFGTPMGRLDASRFRFLNEQLYTQPSSAAAKLFQEDPDAFRIYHKGYKFQLDKWPVKPLEKLVMDLGTLPSGSVIADMGCGDAKLAKQLGDKFQVHSFDLVATNERVTKADMANIPLESGSVDICVYCLSLMGTNLAQFFREAHRLLKMHGKIKIVEIASRFRSIGLFIAATEKMGFQLKRKKMVGNLFIMLTLEKTDNKIANKRPQHLHLDPCRYKKR